MTQVRSLSKLPSVGDAALFISFCQQSHCHSVQRSGRLFVFFRPALRSSAADSLMLVRSSPCRLSLADGSSLLFAVKALSQHNAARVQECD